MTSMPSGRRQFAATTPGLQKAGLHGLASDVRHELDAGTIQQDALGAISQLALRPIEIQEFVDRCAAAVAAALHVDRVGVFMLSVDNRLLTLAGGAGWPGAHFNVRSFPPAASRPLAQALSIDDPVAFSGSELAAPGTSATGSGIAVAIGERAARAGLLTITSNDSRRRFASGELSFLRTVAFIVAAVWERRRSQDVLTLRNRVLEELEQGIMITDASRIDDPLIYVNGAFERLTGYSAAEVMGRNPRFLQGEETDRAALRGLVEARRAGSPYRCTLVNYRRDGTAFWNDLTISTVHGPRGAITHHVGILCDVSEHLRLEAQLRQAQKMEAIGHLTGGIAHDFNNLLAVILGNSEILLEDAADEHVREMVRLVMGTAERGAVLTQRLLAFGRRQALRPEPIEVAPALASLVEMLQRTLGEQVQLVATDDGSAASALADRALFESAVVNLAVNARDAMPNGGQLTLRSRLVKVPGDRSVPELAEGRYACVSIEDTGTGMTSDVLARVFEPFFTTKEVGRGSGLGLPMVYGFARQSGGQVTIDSAPGEGTIVSLYLPLAPPMPERRQIERRRDDPMPPGTECILLVEDEREVRRFVSRALERLGYGVLEAEDARSALGVLERNDGIDLLFSDLILPGGQNGLKLVEAARTLRPDIKVLLTTGYTEEYERIARASPGLILRKPYRRQQLAHTLRRVLDAA